MIEEYESISNLMKYNPIVAILMCLVSLVSYSQSRTDYTEITRKLDISKTQHLIEVEDDLFIRVSADFKLSKTMFYIDKLDEHLNTIENKEVEVKQGFGYNFTYNYSNLDIHVLNDKLYIFAANQRTNHVNLFSLIISLKDLEVLKPLELVHSVKGKVNDETNDLYADGYFIVSSDVKNSSIVITSIEERKSFLPYDFIRMIEKKKLKKNYNQDVQVRHAIYNHDLILKDELISIENYTLEFELSCPIILNGKYFLLLRKGKEDTGYVHSLVSLDLKDLKNKREFSISEDILINELKIYSLNDQIYAAGTTAVMEHVFPLKKGLASESIFVYHFNESQGFNNVVSYTYTDEEILRNYPLNIEGMVLKGYQNEGLSKFQVKIEDLDVDAEGNIFIVTNEFSTLTVFKSFFRHSEINSQVRDYYSIDLLSFDNRGKTNWTESIKRFTENDTYSGRINVLHKANEVYIIYNNSISDYDSRGLKGTSAVCSSFNKSDIKNISEEPLLTIISGSKGSISLPREGQIKNRPKNRFYFFTTNDKNLELGKLDF